MRNYFIRYYPTADINYLYLFMLYGIAEYNVSRKCYDTISYSSIKQLSNRITDVYKDKAFSYSTLRRILQDTNYANYITVYNNKIML